MIRDRYPGTGAPDPPFCVVGCPLALVCWWLQIWVFWRRVGMRARIAMRLPGLDCRHGPGPAGIRRGRAEASPDDGGRAAILGAVQEYRSGGLGQGGGERDEGDLPAGMPPAVITWAVPRR
jgi:hypothetical protein